MRGIVRIQRRHAAQPRRQRGLSLVESLVALLVLTLGIMGLAGVQARMVVETRTTNSRAVAVGLIDDLVNRMMLNRQLAAAGGYALAFSPVVPAAPADCAAIACNEVQRAAWDLNLWRTSVGNLLSGGQSAVFSSNVDPRQIGVMIAWRANEGKTRSGGVDPVDAAYQAPFAVLTGTATACPPTFLCHLVYVQP
ncbi:type IV pilus modification protein PilV [Rhodoferax sp.]|uniref:type IV pilus modification protein PilV n=1 Tax=Rhodoferax sp. TaxID=50421 RepID=UPI002762CA9B|nr:type IV pilus modification protein PilV [Rhodoferax sp.]